MARNEYRDDDDAVVSIPDNYWRRRAITLALGLGLLGILAWAFSGGGGKPQASPTNLMPANALGTAVPGIPGTGLTPSGTSGPSGSPGPSASGSVSPPGTANSSGSSPSGTAKPSKGAPASARGNRKAAASPSPTASGGCAPGSVVLSLFTDRASYRPQDLPQFSIYAVSTTAAGCTFNPGQLQVVVMSSDRVVWASTDCTKPIGHGSHATLLARGVPVQDEVIWNRAITLPGCQILAPSARNGIYSVQARTESVQSPVRYFKLSG